MRKCFLIGKKITFDFINGFLKNDLSNLACQISFRLLMGIFPFILFLITLVSYIPIDTSLLSQYADVLPNFTVQIISLFINDITQNTTPIGLISSTFIFAIYSSAKAFKTIIEAINKLYYGEVTMSIIKRYCLALVFVFLFFFLVILPFVYYIFSDAIWDTIYFLFNIKIGAISWADSLLIFICMFSYLTILVMLMYGMSLGKKMKIRSHFVGAVVCVTTWWLSSYGFNFYVNNFSRYSTVYGSIGTIILFFLWIEIITLVLLVGALINKLIYRYYKEDFHILDN